MGQGSKNKTVFDLPVEITLVTWLVSTFKNYYVKSLCNVSNDFEFSNVSEEDVT